MPLDNTPSFSAQAELNHEACPINACRALGAGCRFAVYEPDPGLGRAAAFAAPGANPPPGARQAHGATARLTANQTDFNARRPRFNPAAAPDASLHTAPDTLAWEAEPPLVTATYEAEPDTADDHPLAGQAAYLRRENAPGRASGGQYTAFAAAASGATPGAVSAASAASGDAGRGAGLILALREAVQASGWPRFLARHTGGVIRRHEAFGVSICGCANACANPHIADLGFIAVWRPELDPSRCLGAGACAKNLPAAPCLSACPEQAISLAGQQPTVNRKICLDCGRCVKACPALALSSGPRGWRILVGGRLGRHPRLALPLPGIFQTQALPAALKACLELYMRHYTPGARFAQTVLAHKAKLLKIMASHNHI